MPSVKTLLELEPLETATAPIPANESGASTPDSPRRRSLVLGILCLVVLVAGGGYAKFRTSLGGSIGGAGQSASSLPPAGPPVSVATFVASKRDVPIVIEGLGTVTPIAAVTIRPQLDARLEKVLFEEGQEVKKGTVLAVLDPRAYSITVRVNEANLARDQAQLERNRLTLARAESLRSQNVGSQQEVDDARGLMAQLTATLQADRASLDMSRLMLDYTRIVSPIDGVVGVRLVDAGNLVKANDPNGIVVVTQLDPIAVVFTVPQDDLAQIASARASGPLPVDLLSREGDTKIAVGQVSAVDNQVNVQTGTLRVKAVVPNASHALWPNAFVKARIVVSSRRGVVVVPTVAVQRGPKGTFVYVLDGTDSASVRPVVLERTVGDDAIVEKGLSVGDVVVTDGQSQLRPGSKVVRRGAESAPGAPAKSKGPKP